MPFVIGAILIIVGAAVYALWKKGVLSGLLADAKPEQVKMPYRKKDYLLSKAERSFYEVLTQCVGPDLAIFSKRYVFSIWCSWPRGPRTRRAFAIGCSQSTWTSFSVDETRSRRSSS